MDKKEYDKGYNDAIEAAKRVKNGEGLEGQQGGQSNSKGDWQPTIPSDISGQEKQGGKSNGSNGNNPGRGRGPQGKVRPEDVLDPTGNLEGTPGTPGSTIDSNTGNKIVEKEGYEKDTRSDSAVENEWKNLGERAARKWTGQGPMGVLKSKIESIWKTTTDWKAALKRIIGHAISPDDKRRAFTNKNILTSQDRIARTDKDKFNAISYMVIILDVSGSMWNDKIRQMMCEAYSVALQKKPLRIMTIQNDHGLQEVVIHNNLRDFEKYVKTITMKGGGGNDLQPVWDFLRGKSSNFKEEYNKIKGCGAADIVMNFTDGFLTQLKRDPITMKNLCWCIVDNPGFDLQYKDNNTYCIRLKDKNDVN